MKRVIYHKILSSIYYEISEDDLSVETAQKMYYRARYPQHVISAKKRKEVIDSQPKLFDY